MTMAEQEASIVPVAPVPAPVPVAPVPVAAVPAAPVVPPVVLPTKRGASFSEQEQKCLTQAWLETSVDPIHGNDQKGTDFYKSVSDRFKEKMGALYTTRSPESLHSHWRDTIQSNVAKFSSAFTKATSKKISGYNSEDYLREAQVIFVAESKTKKPFKLLHCWEILKTHSKWCPGRSDASPTNSIIGPELDRPMGCQAAKKAKVEGKAKGKAEAEKLTHLKHAIETIGKSNRDRQSMATLTHNLNEKANALKELRFFAADTSEEGKEILKTLRANYIAKYVQKQNTPATTLPAIGATPTTNMTNTGTPSTNSSVTIDTTTVYETPVADANKTLSYDV